MRIIRLICFLCRSNKDLKLLLSIVYDIIYSKTQNFHIILSVIARICPTLLQLPVDDTDDRNPILLVVMYLTRNEFINLDFRLKMSKISGDENQWKLHLSLFERLCNWKFNFSSSSEMFSHLLPTLKANVIFDDSYQEYKFSSKANEYLLAFQLMCKFEGWKWTLDVFIKQFIQELLAPWASSKGNQNKLDSKIDDNLISFVFYLQANLVALLCPHDERHQAIDIIKASALFIKEYNFDYCSLVIQCKIIEGLLLLAPRDPTLVFTEIQHWLKPSNIAINNSLPESLKTKIRSVFNMLKPKLPNYMIVNI